MKHLIVTTTLSLTMLFSGASIAKSSGAACEEFAPDLLSELVYRGYSASTPFSCNAVETSQGNYDFTLVVNGIKELVHCDSVECN